MSAIDLCARMLQHAVWADHTKGKRPSELKDALRFFFTNEEIDTAVAVITGRAPATETRPSNHTNTGD